MLLSAASAGSYSLQTVSCRAGRVRESSVTLAGTLSPVINLAQVCSVQAVCTLPVARSR